MATTSPWYSLIWCAVVALMTMASFLQSSKRANCLTIFRGSIFLFFPEIYKTHQETFPVKFTIYKNFYLSRNKFLPKILFLKAIYIDIYGMHALPLPLPYQNGRGGGSGEERVKTLEKYLRWWRWGLVGWVKLPGLGKGGRGEGVKKKIRTMRIPVLSYFSWRSATPLPQVFSMTLSRAIKMSFTDKVKTCSKCF